MPNTPTLRAYQTWLEGLDDGALTDLIERRPAAVAGAPVRSHTDLAARLSSPHALQLAIRDLDRGALGMLQLVAGLGPLGRPEIGHWTNEGDDTTAVDAALASLTRLGLAWDESGRYRTVDLSILLEYPLELGRTVAELFVVSTDTAGRARVLKNLGLAPGGRKADRALDVAAAMTPELIARLVREAPADVRMTLNGFVEQPDRVVYGGMSRSADPVRWAVDHGLLVQIEYNTYEMPREVGLVVRGPDWRPDLDVTAPDFPDIVADRDVEAAAAHAVAALLDTTAAVLAAVDGRPLPLLKAGGVGVREVRALAKITGVGEEAVGFALELCGEAGLVGVGDGVVAPTAEFDRWRREPRSGQAADLVAAWWSAPCSPSHRIPGAGDKPLPVLKYMAPDAVVPEARTRLLGGLAGWPAGAAAGSADEAVLLLAWSAPLLVQALGTAHIEAAWRECERVGATGHGALSRIGAVLAPLRAGIGADPDELRRAVEPVLRELLPDVAADVKILSDLTVVVTGAADPTFVDVLDGAARRESRGVASTWRFDGTSVRGFLDAGGDPDTLLTTLTDAASTPVPQALEYLVRDVARRHGGVVVREAGCCIVSDDTALLAEIAATAALRKLAITRIAPTVLVSAGTVEATLEQLRGAGFSPSRRDVSGALAVERQARTRVSEPERRADRVLLTEFLRSARTERVAESTADLVARLRSGTPPPTSPAVTSMVGEIGTHALHLGEAEVHWLADAVDRGEAVRITYRNKDGNTSDRIIEDLDLRGASLYAWCSLRDDARWFRLDGLLAVSPVE